jgi:hypothetical protein
MWRACWSTARAPGVVKPTLSHELGSASDCPKGQFMQRWPDHGIEEPGYGHSCQPGRPQELEK